MTESKMKSIDMEDRITPRALTMDELWKSWDILSTDEADTYLADQNTALCAHDALLGPEVRLEKNGCDCWRCAKLPGPFVRDTEYPRTRFLYALECPFMYSLSRWKSNERMYIIMVLLAVAVIDEPPKTYISYRLMELKAKTEEEQSKSVEEKLEQAEMYKNWGNEFYRRGDWRQGAFNYARAWTSLLPYHYQAFDAKDPRHTAVAKFNITALALLALEDKTLSHDHKVQLRDKGILAASCVRTMGAYATCGLVLKSLQRATRLWVEYDKYATYVGKDKNIYDLERLTVPMMLKTWASRLEKREDYDPKAMYRHDMDFTLKRTLAMAACP